MNLQTLATAPAALLAFLLAACGSGTATSTTGSGGAGARTPTVHRVAETPCTAARPPGGGGSGDPMDMCAADAECIAGTTGRCVAGVGQPAFCSYDECAADADCGSVTVCECRHAASYDANTCIKGTCRVDADCGAGGFCSPSAISVSTFCMEGIEMGSIGYFCHQPEDECVDDADCGQPMASVCLFSVGKMRWVCHELMCVL